MFKRFLISLFTLVLLCCSIPQTHADETPPCTVQVTLPGGNLTLYRVGSLLTDGTLQPDGDFSGWRGEATGLQSSDLATKLAQFARENHCIGTTQTLSAPGTLVFDGLQPSVYLLVQTEAAEGFECISPFLVILPSQENGKPVYKVDATPKISLTPTPTVPAPSEPSLPQTGQLKWPVPLLISSGLVLFTFGLYLQKRKNNG